MGTAPQAVEDQRSGAELVLEILASEHLSALSPGEAGELGRVEYVDRRTGCGFGELGHLIAPQGSTIGTAAGARPSHLPGR
jgi:hypothetical protein